MTYIPSNVAIDNKKEAITINWGYAKVNESSVDVLVDGAVALNISDSSKLKENLQRIGFKFKQK